MNTGPETNPSNMRIEITYPDDPWDMPIETTWGGFADANADAFDEKTLCEWMEILIWGDTVTDGGGAAPAFTLRRIPPEYEPTCAACYADSRGVHPCGEEH